MIIAAFGLDRLDDDGAHWVRKGGNDMVGSFETPLLLCSIFCLVLVQRVL